MDKYRQHSESDKQWSAKHQFIKRHMTEYEGKARSKLLALSMVWVNHVFLGCSYDPQLMHKVLEMAEGIDVGELPSSELVPSAEAKKRPCPSDENEQPMKKIAMQINGARPQLKPVQFMSADSSSNGTGETDKKENENDVKLRDPDPEVSDSPSRSDSGPLPTPSLPAPVLVPALEEKQRLIAKLQSVLAITLIDPAFMMGPDPPDYNVILRRSIRACKTKPEYIYVNLKDIPPSDLPKTSKVPPEGFACELRCQGVYLSTGYASSKNGARNQASKLVIKLFMRRVEVRVVKRQYKDSYIDEMMVCHVTVQKPKLPPPILNPEDKPPPPRTKSRVCVQDELVLQGKGTKKSSKPAAAKAAIRKLRKSQPEQPQPVQPQPVQPQPVQPQPVQPQPVQQQPQQQQPQQPQHLSEGNHSLEQSSGCAVQHCHRKIQFSQLVILENSDNAISVINQTANFNKVPVDYTFTALPDNHWKCDVYLCSQFVASGVGLKTTVKHIAAKEALATLKQTHAVVKSNLRIKANEDAISRNKIIARSGVKDVCQKIKEDNIGNQMLRKMGWKGGGLGREGEGIVEPIRVKEQFTRQGLGMDINGQGKQLAERDLKKVILDYVNSGCQDDLHFTTELSREERKQIHHISNRYGLQSRSYGHGKKRFLVVSQKVQRDQLICQLLQKGQVGRFELIKPQTFQ